MRACVRACVLQVEDGEEGEEGERQRQGQAVALRVAEAKAEATLAPRLADSIGDDHLAIAKDAYEIELETAAPVVPLRCQVTGGGFENPFEGLELDGREFGRWLGLPNSCETAAPEAPANGCPVLKHQPQLAYPVLMQTAAVVVATVSAVQWRIDGLPMHRRRRRRLTRCARN